MVNCRPWGSGQVFSQELLPIKESARSNPIAITDSQFGIFLSLVLLWSLLKTVSRLEEEKTLSEVAELAGIPRILLAYPARAGEHEPSSVYALSERNSANLNMIAGALAVLNLDEIECESLQTHSTTLFHNRGETPASSYLATQEAASLSQPKVAT